MTNNIKTDLVHPFTNSDKNEKENLNTNYSTQENKKNIINLALKEKDKEKKAKKINLPKKIIQQNYHKQKK